MKGLIHLYFGEGKGKTTAAMGLALRFLGHGRGVVIAQFLKNGTSGECLALARMGGAEVLAANPLGKFVSEMSADEKKLTQEAVRRTFEAATEFVQREGTGLLVLDEVCAAISTGLLDEAVLISFLDRKPEALEIVLTGRNPTGTLKARADYLIEMRSLRHPFEKGIKAREGVEF